jgi:hypothetical protein
VKIQNLLTYLTGSFKLPNVYKDKDPKKKIIKLKKNKYGAENPSSLFTGGYTVPVSDIGGGEGNGGGVE